MTITDNGPAVDEALVAKGRELVEGGRLPGKRQLREHLRKGWDVVNAVQARLGEEAERAAAEKRASRRTAMRRLTGRKRPAAAALGGRQRQRAVNESPVSAPPSPLPELAAVDTSDVVQERTPLAAETVNKIRLRQKVVTWPALIVAAPAFVAIWAGWVAIGRMTGFGPVNLLPGFGDGLTVDTAITLPVGVEAYAGYAFYVALNPAAPKRARAFAAWSACLAVLLGMGGQTAYHLMTAAGMQLAPWQITTVVSCLPVAVFGLVAALVHMVRAGEEVNE